MRLSHPHSRHFIIRSPDRSMMDDVSRGRARHQSEKDGKGLRWMGVRQGKTCKRRVRHDDAHAENLNGSVDRLSFHGGTVSMSRHHACIHACHACMLTLTCMHAERRRTRRLISAKRPTKILGISVGSQREKTFHLRYNANASREKRVR